MGVIQPAPAASPRPPIEDRPGVSVRVERRHERFDYHVENPSNFEPRPLVPHVFEQRYDADSSWMLVKAIYRIAGEVITSGTRGDVRLRRFSIQQWSEMATWGVARLGLTAAYRHSAMDFLPSERIITRTPPPVEIREPVGGDETTWSHVLATGVAASVPMALGTEWRLAIDGEAMPLTRRSRPAVVGLSPVGGLWRTSHWR